MARPSLFGPSAETLAALQDALEALRRDVRQELDAVRGEVRAQADQLEQVVAQAKSGETRLLAELERRFADRAVTLDRRLADLDAREVGRVNGVHGRLDVTRAEIAEAAQRLDERFEAADRIERDRVNGVHGRLDVTRAEFSNTVERLVQHVGESQHRLGLMTAEMQRATDVFDLKLATVESQMDRGLKAMSEFLSERTPASPDQDG